MLKLHHDFMYPLYYRILSFKNAACSVNEYSNFGIYFICLVSEKTHILSQTFCSNA